MWKARSDEKTTSNQFQPAAAHPPLANSNLPASSRENMKSAESFRNEVGHIGKSVMIRGELSGSEDLYLDGQVEGSIDLRDHSLTIGPNGRIKASISAREIVVHGKVDGDLHATERVELKRSSSLTGDVLTQRIVIEDGAFFKGAIDIQKEQKDSKAEARKGMTVAAAASSSSTAPLLTSAPGTQASFLEAK